MCTEIMRIVKCRLTINFNGIMGRHADMFRKRLMYGNTHGMRITLGCGSFYALTSDMVMGFVTRLTKCTPDVNTIGGNSPRFLDELLAIRGSTLCGA